MAASAAVSYIASPQFPHAHKGCSQHADMHQTRITSVFYSQETKRSIWYHQQRAHVGRSLTCRGMHGAGSQSEDWSGKWVSEKEAWRALKDQVDSFKGEFPRGAAAATLQALVEKLDAVADTSNPQMQILLGQAKRFLRCPRASLAHYLNVVRNSEDPRDPQLGAWYLETGLACREAGDFEGALHFCTQALQSSMEFFGPSSLRVAQARSALSKSYFHLGRYDDSIDVGQMARPIMKNLATLPEVIFLELTMADALFNLNRYNDVVSILKDVLDNTNSSVHVKANIMTARAYAAMGKNTDAKTHCQKAFDRLDILEPSVTSAAQYVMLASMYEEQQEFQQAALVLTKGLQMYKEVSTNNPKDFIAELEGKLGRLLLQLRNVKDALPYLERHLSKKQNVAQYPSKEKSKEAHELLHAHYYLGAAYSQCAEFEKALEHFETCTRLLSNVCIGENPSFTMTVYNNTASMHYHLKRLDKAIECQRAAVDVVKRNKLQETNVTKRIEALLEEYLQEAKT